MTSVFFFLMGSGHGGGCIGSSGVLFCDTDVFAGANVLLAGAVEVLVSVAGGATDFRWLVGGRIGDIGVRTGVDFSVRSRTASASQ